MNLTDLDDDARPLGAHPGPPRASRVWSTLGPIGCVIFVLIAVLGIVTPRGLPPRAQGKLTACKSNLRNLATALEMYAEEHKGHHPASLEALLSGNYLKYIPTCPAAGELTYTDYKLVRTSAGEEFQLSCVGDHHRDAYRAFPDPSVNFPHYSSRLGLVDHP